MPWYSPLFRQASEAVLQAAMGDFSRSSTGVLFREFEREVRRPIVESDRLGRALRRYSSHGTGDALRDLRGTQFGQFAREIERYARGDFGMRKLLDQFLNELGPAGRLIRALSGSTGGGEVDKLISALQAFGYEVLPPDSARRRGEPVTERGIEAAQAYLDWAGAPATDREKRTGLPFGIPARGEDGQERGYVPLPMADGPERRFGVDHPIVTGEMIEARSSNVHSFGYDIESTYLYVRFLGYVKGQRGADGRAARGGPGSLYRYRDVTPEEFLTLMAANSKGEWVWDHLRVRGTWSGHQKDYELVGIAAGYVPRKATVRRNPQSGALEEYFKQRRVRPIGGGAWITSALQDEVAGDLPWGQIDRGRPDNGRPDAGRPDTGRP